MKDEFIIDNESEVALLEQSVAWFLRTQDPELDDAVYDGNDRIIIKDILLPRIACPFDVNAGTTKDLGLLIQCLETALSNDADGLERSAAAKLLGKLRDYAATKRRRLLDAVTGGDSTLPDH